MDNLNFLRDLLDSDLMVSSNEFDENFNAITSCVENGQQDEALLLITIAFEKKVLDVRLVMYFLSFYFLETGLKSLSEILPILNSLMETHWEKLSPVIKRENHVQKSLGWLFTRLLKALEITHRAFKQEDLGPLKKITLGLTPTILSDIQNLSVEFSKRVSTKWPDNQLIHRFLRLSKSVDEIIQMSETKPLEGKILDVTSSEIPPPNKTATKRKKSKKTSLSLVDTPLEANVIESQKENKTVGDYSYSYSVPLASLEPSVALGQLYKKLEAFQLLIERKAFKKAALVAQNIDDCLATFDPTAYFPKLFVNYFSLYAKFSSSLAEHENRDTLLEKLYATDLDAFIEWE